jgi:ABC-type sulfate transport system permease component
MDVTNWSAIRLPMHLATTVTVLVLVIGTPIAWWLTHSHIAPERKLAVAGQDPESTVDLLRRTAAT